MFNTETANRAVLIQTRPLRIQNFSELLSWCLFENVKLSKRNSLKFFIFIVLQDLVFKSMQNKNCVTSFTRHDVDA